MTGIAGMNGTLRNYMYVGRNVCSKSLHMMQLRVQYCIIFSHIICIETDYYLPWDSEVEFSEQYALDVHKAHIL